MCWPWSGAARRTPARMRENFTGVPITGMSPSRGWLARSIIERAAVCASFITWSTVLTGVAGTPAFYGSNPAEVRQGPRKGLRTLAGEEDRARELLKALDEKQLAVALIKKDAPNDILSTNSRKADVGPPVGLPASKMTKKQQELLTALLEEYSNNMTADVASARMEQIRRAGMEKVRFAWMGGLQRGEKHYYRVQGPTFLVEYDNFQNDANHIHAVWRNFDGDFGADLLGAHLKEAHSKGSDHQE